MAKERMRLAYLVRLWQVDSNGQVVWRASLEDAYTGEKKGFGDPASLFAFLQAQLCLAPQRAKDGNSPCPPTRSSP